MTITTQNLYDWREETEAISGTDLQRLFERICGEPSPAGATPVNWDVLNTVLYDFAHPDQDPGEAQTQAAANLEQYLYNLAGVRAN
jgi:hypothetical protein